MADKTDDVKITEVETIDVEITEEMEEEFSSMGKGDDE